MHNSMQLPIATGPTQAFARLLTLRGDQPLAPVKSPQGQEPGLQAILATMGALGTVVTSGADLQSAIRNYSRDKGPILLAPGTYDLRGGIVINRDHVSIVALFPGHSVLRRQATGSMDPLISITHDHVTVRGLVLDDAATATAIDVTGDYVTVDNCRFDNCYHAIQVDGAPANVGVVISNNLIRVTRAPYTVYTAFTGEPVVVLNHVTYGLITGNRILTEDSPLILGSADVSATSFTGNIMTSGNVVYPTGVGNVDAANQPAATPY